ncbi:MAG: nitrate reductase subunit alpha [Deltaproteobacteria bacterium]|nr:nitrate reductase subunit alpha [Deltaproteobacteria bacterium]
MSWIKDIVDPETRAWEQFYRNRWQHDKVVRSTHGVNCTGGCSWNIYVKEGVVTWEMQALDYPLLDRSLPPYEPRGCQRGISYSWYIYSPIRVKYPYVRGALLDLWRDARKQYDDPVEAWASIQANEKGRALYQRARGKGGFRRAAWSDVLEIVAAANIHTAKKYGPDRVIGFAPIPAMSMLSYAAGARFLQLFGGVCLSFYDWYCDLPPASPEIWGEQTDVGESADWYNSKFTAVMGSNPNMTRTPDCHFAAEMRHNGTKLVVFSPDFSQVAKYADQWVPLHAGSDGAFWMAVNHVILKERHHEEPSKLFLEYVRRYTDSPMLIKLEKDGDAYKPGRLLRANTLEKYKDVENGEWKFLVIDEATGEAKMPGGTMGHRWQKNGGQWNLEYKDTADGSEYSPALSFLTKNDEVAQVRFNDFGSDSVVTRGIPIRFVETREGRVAVATIYDLLFGEFGVGRGLPGEYAKSFDDENATYTPAWQEKFTGVSRNTVLQFAREWARTAELTGGKCMIIIGAGINHWYHNNLMYRSGIVALMLTGCVGKNGGGLNHYVGQEKLATVAPWAAMAFARDWSGPPRLQNAPSWHYMQTDQWRYDAGHSHYGVVPKDSPERGVHTADMQARAVRLGWLPWYPQFPENPLEAVKAAEAAGAKTNEEILAHIAKRIEKGDLKYSVDDVDAAAAWPRVWYIWRGNALMSSAKGHEFFLKHYLGTHHNDICDEHAAGKVKDVAWHDKAPEGKMDLVVDINFRMDTSALYSDIVLPTATFYEKADLNSTDLHSFIHPLGEAVPPSWESKPDWDIFKEIAKKTSEVARRHFPTPVKDVVMTPLAHDTVDELAQPSIKDWRKGECAFVPGKTTQRFTIVERDYTKLWEKYTSLGPNIKKDGLGAHGVKYDCADFYDELAAENPTIKFDGQVYPSIEFAPDAANVILKLAPETNGELAYRAYKLMEKKTGLVLADLAEGARKSRATYKDLLAQPRRLLNSPAWSGLVTDGRAYSAFTYNIEKRVPFRTLTGRQQFYLDHEGYLAFGEHLPTFKPSPLPAVYQDLDKTESRGNTGPTKILNLLTPHGKWHIHSTYGDTLRMMTLSRGCEPFWMNDKDADEIGIVDNDWVEVHNDNGVYCTRAVVSARIPRGVSIVYHSPERTLNIPKSETRKGRRAGGHNSLTRTRLKPVLMYGGYGQFTFHFNYWGPTGVNRDTHVMVRKMEKVVF